MQWDHIELWDILITDLKQNKFNLESDVYDPS